LIHRQDHQLARAAQFAMVEQSGEVRQRARSVAALPTQDFTNTEMR